MSRTFGSSTYWWMSARSRNASSRFAVMGIAGGLAFIAALIAFVLVPRQATRAAVRVSATLEERPDSGRTVAERNRAVAAITSADSALALARQVIIAPVVQVIDTFPPEAIARREALSRDVATLNRLIERANNAPLPSSYRALGNSAPMAGDPQVQPLLDQLAELERERDAFGTVGGVDPVYVALTSRATAVGRSIQSIAEVRRATLRQELATLRPPPPPRRPRIRVDTARYIAQKQAAQRTYAGAVATLAQMRAANERIDKELARARELANVGAPPLAMLAAALVLALTAGFAASLLLELKRPSIADAREAEHVSGVRVLSVIEPSEIVAERSRRQADAAAPPLIDVVSESYRRLYLHLAATEANVPVVTVAGDDAPIVATVAANIAAAAAYEARSTLIVDVDPATSTVASIFRVRSNPGLSGIVAGTAGWAEATVQATVGRDRVLDILPSGTRRRGPPDDEAAERIRGDFARMERRYDLIVIVAPTAYITNGAASVIPGPDVILCARIAHTRIARLKEAVESLRAQDLRIHGLVLWDNDMPVIEAHDEPEMPRRERSQGTSRLAGVR
jgi:Mrp family chromosome partitioning ATPase